MCSLGLATTDNFFSVFKFISVSQKKNETKIDFMSLRDHKVLIGVFQRNFHASL